MFIKHHKFTTALGLLVLAGMVLMYKKKRDRKKSFRGWIDQLLDRIEEMVH